MIEHATAWQFWWCCNTLCGGFAIWDVALFSYQPRYAVLLTRSNFIQFLVNISRFNHLQNKASG
jgi:hypothetical protein